ncbi:hypothetical protein RYX36_011963 [Vicia faba]
MAFHLPQNSFSDKSLGMRPMSSSNPSPPQFPKKTRTKIQASRDSPYGKLRKNSSMETSQTQTIYVMCHKLIHLLPENCLKVYHKKFLNKLVEPEYYVDNTLETELRAKFLKTFIDNNLLKFIGLRNKFNPDHVKAFYCNLVRTTAEIERKFKDHVVKFYYGDFTRYLGLTSSIANIFVDISPEYDRVCFVLSISKLVSENIEISGIKSKEEDLVEVPKIMDECRVSMMRYYSETDGVYYNLRKYGRKVYDDKILEQVKDPSYEASRSSSSLLSVDLKTYLDELVRKILADKKIKQIMAFIDSVSKESEDSQEKLKEELKAEMQVFKARVIVQVYSMRDIVHHLGISNVIFSICPSDHGLEPNVPIPYVTPSDDAVSIL